ncbi:MAG: hypothetical protein EZS28_055089 [Streblomastix strix]|uniref:Uncharacterized protein n=1 Tax=Streblomastix strix TaxID=222440 RepID=A0A5J4Q8D4_9EUKA|nr:MAG: hypothetical protein EZS28_055089 [Streblomastix strix]
MSVDMNSKSSFQQQKPLHHNIPALIPETCQLQKGILSQTQKVQTSKFPKNSMDVLKDDADNYTQLDDEYMESKGSNVYVDERIREVQAVVKEYGLLAPYTWRDIALLLH